MRNIERKLRRPETDQMDQRLAESDAKHIWHRKQRDTFWEVPVGWLKLREVLDGASDAQLIGYRRSRESGDARPSDYEIVEFADAQPITKLLDATLPRLGVVEKQRDLWIWKQTRIHLDDVVGLGHFVELETVLGDIDESEGVQQNQACLEMLELSDAETLAVPYLELLLQVANN